MEKIELLAPVGNTETFQAALEGGADGVYVGAPGFNARNLAKDIRLDEIGAMIRYCHERKKKLYIAANSLILESEIPHVIETLALLSELAPDALIVQDLGLVRLIRDYFPGLKLHGSTLMTVHNSAGVQFLDSLGFERVVLARELTLEEIAKVSAQRGRAELEIFIHGAMCFSYSGLCLFSSYLGGKSGLRGKCVQPCRRGYTGDSQHNSRYLFSMNDLSGLEAVPALREAGVSSLKVEGRLRSAHYVRTVISAYRKVIDASSDGAEDALGEAQKLVAGAMSRKTSSGYFFTPQPVEAISPYQSGSMGIHLGRFSAIKMVGNQQVCRFVLKSDLSVGDRLRLHAEPTGDRTSFRLKTLFVTGEQKKSAVAGEKASIALPEEFQIEKNGHAEVYKVDSASGTGSAGNIALQVGSVAEKLAVKKKRMADRIEELVDNVTVIRNDATPGSFGKVPVPRGPRKNHIRKKIPLDLWLKTDSVRSITGKLPFYPDRFLLTLNTQTVNGAGKIKAYLGKQSRMVTWALPPLILDGDFPRYQRQITQLLRIGFRSFQIGHISQVDLFDDERVHLSSDYTVNILNNQSVELAAELGLRSIQASIEVNRDALQALLTTFKSRSGGRQLQIGLTVFGAPALYTSRITDNHLQYDKRIYSPRKESYIMRKKDGLTQTFPEKPFSLLPYLTDLKELGLSYVVVDITGTKVSKRELSELRERLYNTGKYGKLSTFNYLGNLY